jgi:hypothetical protein
MEEDLKLDMTEYFMQQLVMNMKGVYLKDPATLVGKHKRML